MSNHKLPTVTSNIPRDLRMFIDRVREIVGKDLVTKSEVTRLIRDGGTGGGGGAVVSPTHPTNLKAVGIIGAIELTWDAATYAGHSHTEIWACDSDTRDQAVAVGSSPGTAFGHAVGPLKEKFYWIRHVNTSNEAGPFNAENGTFAKSLADEGGGWTTIIQELDESLLTKLLLEKLNWSQIMELRQEMNRYLDKFTEIDGEYETITGAPAWDREKVYKKGDTVSYKGGLYEALVASGPTTIDMHPAAATKRWNQIGSALRLKTDLDSTDNYARVTLTNRVTKEESVSTALLNAGVVKLIPASGTTPERYAIADAATGLITGVQFKDTGSTTFASLINKVTSALKREDGKGLVSANIVDAMHTEIKDSRDGRSSLAERFSALVTEIAGKASAGSFNSLKALVENSKTGLATKASVDSVKALYAALGGVLDDPKKPPKSLAQVEEKINVWAATDDAGATYTLKMRAGVGNDAANVGFGMAAVKEKGRWIGDVRINAQRFAIMDPTLPDGRIYPFIVNDGIVYIDRLNVGTINIAANAVSLSVGGTADGYIPSAVIVMDAPGAIIVIVTANILATGKGVASASAWAICGPWTGQGVGISMPDSFSGSITAIGHFYVGPGTYGVGGGTRIDGPNRRVGACGMAAFGLKR